MMNCFRVEAVQYSGNKGVLHFSKRYKTLAQAKKSYSECLNKYNCHITLTDESNVISKGIFSWGYKLLKYRESLNIK